MAEIATTTETAPSHYRLGERLDRSIVLVGLMGSGKSNVGRRLAQRLGWDFKDSDQEFEVAAGCTIADYFAQHGEPAFREGERRVIARLLDGGKYVLATGGGAFLDPETRSKIKAAAYSIWLKADLDLLVRRTSGRDHRPLLKTGDPRAILADLIERRYPVYGLSDIAVETTDAPPEATTKTVLDALEHFLEAHT